MPSSLHVLVYSVPTITPFVSPLHRCGRRGDCGTDGVRALSKVTQQGSGQSPDVRTRRLAPDSTLALHDTQIPTLQRWRHPCVCKKRRPVSLRFQELARGSTRALPAAPRAGIAPLQPLTQTLPGLSTGPAQGQGGLNDQKFLQGSTLREVL